MFFRRRLCMSCVCIMCITGYGQLVSKHPMCTATGEKAQVPHLTGSYMCASVCCPSLTAHHRCTHGALWITLSSYQPFGFCQLSPFHFSSFSLLFPSYNSFSSLMPSIVCGGRVCVCVCACVCVCVCVFVSVYCILISLLASWGKKKSQDWVIPVNIFRLRKLGFQIKSGTMVLVRIIFQFTFSS